MSTKENDFYQQLRKRIRDWEKSEDSKSHQYMEYILAVPDFFYVIWQLAFDDRIPKDIKFKLGGLIAYWILPFDIIPDMIFGPLGFLDDLALTAALLNSIMDDHGDIVKEHWKKVSDEDILKTIQNIIADLDNVIGSGLWKRAKTVYDNLIGI